MSVALSRRELQPQYSEVRGAGMEEGGVLQPLSNIKIEDLP